VPTDTVPANQEPGCPCLGDLEVTLADRAGTRLWLWHPHWEVISLRFDGLYVYARWCHQALSALWNTAPANEALDLPLEVRGRLSLGPTRRLSKSTCREVEGLFLAVLRYIRRWTQPP